MTTRRLLNAGAVHGIFDRVLERFLQYVMSAYLTAHRIDRSLARGKYVLPDPRARGIRVFALECDRQIDRTQPKRTIPLVNVANMLNMLTEESAQTVGQHCCPVLHSFAIAHNGAAVAEIDVFHPQT